MGKQSLAQVSWESDIPNIKSAPAAADVVACSRQIFQQNLRKLHQCGVVRRNRQIHWLFVPGVEQQSSEDSFESEELTSVGEADREGVGGGVVQEEVGGGVGEEEVVGAGRIGWECKAQGRDGSARGSFCRRSMLGSRYCILYFVSYKINLFILCFVFCIFISNFVIDNAWVQRAGTAALGTEARAGATQPQELRVEK